ncbi:MAG: hypothetical protein NW224_28195 [Leptolyngbyaceae cyanobacterium bins.302]|nr:hypothetical protein [Leptolyngbyaceae cyanobacterium bins.302]
MSILGELSDSPVPNFPGRRSQETRRTDIALLAEWSERSATDRKVADGSISGQGFAI